MARTQINSKNIANRDITGASFIPELGFYDETANYSANTIVLYKGQKYITKNSITSSTLEGDLSNAPDVSSDWEVLKPAICSIRPSTSDTFNNTRSTISFDTIRYESRSGAFSVSAGEITFHANGTFLIQVSLSFDNSGSNRNTITSYISIDTGSGYNDINEVALFNYSRNSNDGKDTSSYLLPIDVSINDKLRVQSIGRLTDDVSTITSGCNITIFPILSVSGPQGPTGPAGPSGDLNWLGVYNNSTSYIDRDTVEYQGSTFVSTGNVNGTDPGDPDSPNAPWELVAKKGSDGAGSTVVIQDEGGNIPNTPHGTLNFVGDYVEATDAGSSTTNITITNPKNVYMVQVSAEENAALADDTYEWAFGNGANTPNGNGVSMYVPSAYKCELVAMSLTLRQGTATVQAVQNTNELGSSADVSVSSGQSATNEFTPITFNNADVINFKTTVQSGTGGPNQVTAWFKYTEL